MRISDWSSDVGSSDLNENEEAAGDDAGERQRHGDDPERLDGTTAKVGRRLQQAEVHLLKVGVERQHHEGQVGIHDADVDRGVGVEDGQRLVDHAEIEEGEVRSEEHTSELQSLMRSSYAVFCLKKKKTNQRTDETSNKNR